MAVQYGLRTEQVGVASVHADDCPARSGLRCLCGPLGYRARVWDWNAARWVHSPLLPSEESAREWQRAANRIAAPEPQAEKEVDPSERLFWWAFCFVAVGFIGVAVALFASDIAG